MDRKCPETIIFNKKIVRNKVVIIITSLMVIFLNLEMVSLLFSEITLLWVLSVTEILESLLSIFAHPPEKPPLSYDQPHKWL